MIDDRFKKLQCLEARDGEVWWKPDFEVPVDAVKDPYGIDRRGIISWKNKGNGFFVGAIHFTSFPKKRSIEWFLEETRIFKPWQIDREYNISFKSRAGAKAFSYLLENPKRYRVPNMDLSKIPRNWRIIAGLDYGTTNPTSIHFYAVDPLRRIYSIYEFYKPSNVREIARVLKGVHQGPDIDGVWRDFRHPLWNRCEKLVVDGAIFNKNQETGGEEMTSIGDLLEEQGIYKIERADKSAGSRVAGLSRLHDLMAPPIDPDPKWNPSLYFCESCVWQWKEFTALVYAELPEHALLNKNVPEDIVPKDDHCFAAGTMISTPGEDVPVESIKKGDMVITRLGPRRVLAAGQAGVEPTYVLSFTNGSQLVCTANHPIWTENRGFVRADELRYTDKCLRLAHKNLFSMASSSGAIQTQNTGATEAISNPMGLMETQNFFTEKFGLSQMAKSLMDFTSITRTAIRSIMRFQILSAFPAPSILASMAEGIAIKNLQRGQGIDFFPQTGTPQKLEGSGIQRSRNVFGKICKALKRFALFAESHFHAQAFAPNEQNSVQESAERPILGGAELRCRLVLKTQPVFNMTVEGEHEYFANRILVSNSYDEARYVAMAIAAPSDEAPPPVPEEGTLGSVEKEWDMADAGREEIDYF